MGNYKLATIEVLKELQILGKVDRPIPKADALNLLAKVEGDQKNFRKAIGHNEEAIAIYNQFNDKTFASQ